jgi:hypothetical protein
MDKAKLNSLKKEDQGGESSKQGANLAFLEEQEKENKLNEYNETKNARLESIRAYNDIMDEIDKNGDTMDKEVKEYLLNESIKARNAVDHYANYAQNLKNELNIPSSEEEYSSEEYSSEENSSGENRSGDSSSEESRPSKRPRN